MKYGTPTPLRPSPLPNGMSLNARPAMVTRLAPEWRELTDRIMDGVAARIYPEPYSGRRLPGLLRAAGLERVRLLTDVYQDTTLAPFSKSFLERRAENAVRFGLVAPATAQDWLDGFTALVAGGAFVLTMNYYGAVGVKPGAAP